MADLGRISVKKKRKIEDESDSSMGSLFGTALQKAISDKYGAGDFDIVGGKLARVPTGGAANPEIGNMASAVANSRLQDALAKPDSGLESASTDTTTSEPAGRTFIGNALSAFGKGATGTPIDMGEKGRGWESNLAAAVGAKLGTGLLNAALFGGQTGRAAGIQANPTLYNTPEQQWKLGQAMQQWEAKRKLMLASSPGLLTQQAKTQNMKNQAITLLRQGKVWNKAMGRTQDISSAEEARQYLAGLAFENPAFNPNDPDIEMTLQEMYPEEGSDPLKLLE